MAPRPSENFKQTQPITTTLKVICEYYATNTCLKELLQNADDAGASEIEYVLDTKSYTDAHGPLLHDSLVDYHGPALLVRNNSSFTDEDFTSLASVGDSLKRHDVSKTGKFGQGFNSVYHWTDGPWIYSRTKLLMLDPHESWSKETGMSGGPAWDVVKDDCIEVQNHLKTFGSFNDLDLSKGVDQTIIRIPLRTESQAKISKIVGRVINTHDIKEAFKEFGDEMKEGGLLFLKSICKIIIRIDSNVVATIAIVGDDSDGLGRRNEILTDFKRLYAAHGQDRNEKDHVWKNFELNVKYSAGTISSSERYLIQHNMRQSSGEPDLDEWARKKKLFPWTAIAAPLNDTNGSFRGRLYTVLRLPILTNHPVHIHGLWSIVPDRGRLSSSGESSSFENRWNEFMFKFCVSDSWTKLLLNRNASLLPNEITYSLWPQLVSEPTDIWSMLDNFVIDEIINQKAHVWKTSSGCIPIDQGFFSAKDGEHQTYASALAQIQFPAVFAPLPLLNKTKQRAKALSAEMQILKPSNVRSYIQRNHPPLFNDISPYLLEFCLLDVIFCECDGKPVDVYRKVQKIPIWPLLSTLSLSCLNNTVLLPRDVKEMKFFQSSTAFQTMNLERLTDQVHALLKRDVALIQGMRYRDLNDLKLDWPQMYNVKAGIGGSEHFLPRCADVDPVLCSVWDWICDRKFNGYQHLISVLGGLWLLPIKSNYIRLLGPASQLPPMLIVKKGEPLYDMMLEIWSKVDSVNNQAAVTVLDAEVLPAEATRLLIEQALHNPGLGFAVPQDFGSFVTWLEASRASLARISDQQKVLLLEHLETILRTPSYKNLQPAHLGSKVKALPLFRKPQFGSPYSSQITTRCDLYECSVATKVPIGLPPLPVIPGISFFDPSSDSEKYLLKYFGLLKTMALETLLQNHLLPWAVTAQDQDEKSKKDLINFVFHRATRSNSWATLVADFPIIPLDIVVDSNDQTRYGYLSNVVHPYCDISKLYFARENVFPDPAFFKEHSRALVDFGIKYKLSWPDLVKRIHEFSQCTLGEIGDKVERLLDLPVPYQNYPIVDEIRTLKWIPGTRPGEKSLSLLAPNECRGADMSSCIDFVLGVTRINVKAKWSNLLGWDEPIEGSVLIQQLDECLARKLHQKIEKVLRYIKPSVYPKLRSKPFVRSKHSKDYREPKRIFRPGSLLTKYPMAPLLDEIDPLFEENHVDLIEALNIRKEPSLEDILEAQEAILAVATPLNSADLRIIISSLEIAICLHQPEELSGIMVPDLQGKLRKLPDIVYGDRNISGDASTFNFVHTALSPKLIDGLGIENSLARATRLGINFEDEDEDEYTPREKLTTVISDTLGRYTIESTFTEFLANAEDSGATRISWIVDECQDGPYDSKSLLTPELTTFQGPALFAYNDQVFSDKDFDGFKDIGLGSKSDDATSTGMFGRGALSMYHFTDVPMIISGSSYLILDPQQHSLPRNKHYRRKAGVRMSLSDALRRCPDQLAPFHGLCGYAQENTYYNGTLFRFPLRRNGLTALKENEALVDATKVKRLLDNYQDAGQVSLLFLQNVKNIEACIRGQEIAQWKISRNASEEAIFHTVKVNIQKGTKKPETKIWRVGLTDVDDCPPDIIKPGRGSKKITSCGLAACISHKDMQFKQKIFCTLPTSLASPLPVAFHASFAMSSDRRGIYFNDSIGQSIIPKWNKWLLTNCISKFYVDFLEDIARSEGKNAFQFWPRRSSMPKYAMSEMSEFLIKAFWDVLQDSDSCVLPLVVPEPSSTLVTRPNRVRKLHPTTSFKSAQLDFFQQPNSKSLRPWFLEMFAPLVRPDWGLQQDIEQIKSAKILDGDSIRNLTRDGPGSISLASFLNRSTGEKSERIMKLLEIIVPQSKGQAFKVLDGCRVLPLLDGSLGRLSFEPEEDGQWYFVASSAEEFDLFQFASGCFVNTMPELVRSSRNPLKDITEGLFNIRSVGLGDIAGLLAKAKNKTSSSFSVSGSQESPGKPPLNDEWVPKFWKYLKAKILGSTYAPDSNHELMTRWGLLNYPIYRAKFSETWSYITPQQFEVGRCVIEPDRVKEVDRDQLRALYMDVSSDLFLVDPDCFLDLPDKLYPFIRLIEVLDRISLERKEPINRYLGRLLTPSSRKTLRLLMLGYLVSHTRDDRKVFILRDLPVWPCVGGVSASQNEVAYTSAADGYFCSKRMMLMPWLNRLDRFVDPDIVLKATIPLKNLNVTSMSLKSVWDHVTKNYPKALPNTVSLDQYREFIEFIAKHGLLPPESIAMDGNKNMCQPSSLYDHQDVVFSAAFREQKSTRFLHTVLQLPGLHAFWYRLHLRRSQVDADSLTLLNCARAISTRMSDNPSQELLRDASIVADYLFSKPWPGRVRNEILGLKIFPVREDVSRQKAFRRERMRGLAAMQSHYSLEDVGRQCDERILWSQVPFLRSPAGDVVLRNQLPNDGAPPAEMVFRHLEYLVSIRNELSLTDVVEYLKDILASYSYLQDEAGFTKLIPEVREAAVWANLDISEIDRITIQDFESSLTPAKLLCTNCPADPLPIKVARKFLIPYEKLLRSLGCPTVWQPKENKMTSSTTQSDDLLVPMGLALAKIRQFRDQYQFVDVIFEAEGQFKPAHRIFMVAVSDYCKAQFAGVWGRLHEPQTKIQLQDMTFKALSQMVDYAYTGEVELPMHEPENNEELATQLDECLELLEGANRWLIGRVHTLAEEHILNRANRYVRPDNVVAVKDRAIEVRAPRLVQYCDEFIKNNLDILALYEHTVNNS